MVPVDKFSLVYDAAEDRLAWDNQDRKGVTTRLWLTQRFCKGFVQALAPMLEKAAGGGPPGSEAVVQSCEQAAAMTGFGKTAPVRPDATTPAGLVRAAHIQPSTNGLKVTFEFGVEDSRVIELAFPAIRQMLAVMHRLYVAAGWPLEVWPVWIRAPAADLPPGTVN